MTAVAGCGSGPDIQVTEDRLMAASTSRREGGRRGGDQDSDCPPAA